MKSLFLALGFASSVALAETATISIEGMHCAGCKEMITKKVCEHEGVAKSTASCEVKVTDSEKQHGQITVVSKEGEKIDVDLIKRELSATGEDYKVSGVEVKDVKKMNADDSVAADKTPGTKTVTTTTTVETETVGADGKIEVTKEVKVKKVKTAAKKTTTKKVKK